PGPRGVSPGRVLSRPASRMARSCSRYGPLSLRTSASNRSTRFRIARRALSRIDAFVFLLGARTRAGAFVAIGQNHATGRACLVRTDGDLAANRLEALVPVADGWPP